jgi:hypothetical protein
VKPVSSDLACDVATVDNSGTNHNINTYKFTITAAPVLPKTDPQPGQGVAGRTCKKKKAKKKSAAAAKRCKKKKK